MAIKFFDPTSEFGAFADWEQQTGSNPNTTEQRASMLGQHGDEIRWKGYGKQTALTATFGAIKKNGDLIVPNVGTVVGGVHIDSLSVAYTNTGFPVMTLNGHRHNAGNAHTECRLYRAGVKLPSQFGCPREILEDVPSTKNVFALTTNAEVDVRSVTYTLTCNHVDEANKDGGHLAGDNYDGSETLAVELTGDADAGEYEFDGDNWQLTGDNRTNGNTVATTSSITLTRHVAHDTSTTEETETETETEPEP